MKKLTKRISKSVASRVYLHRDDETGAYMGLEGTDAWMKAHALQKPYNQLALSEEQLNMEINRILTASNPEAPQNIIRFNFREHCFKPVAHVDQMITLLSIDGTILHKDSDEAQRQIARQYGLVEPAKEEELVSESEEEVTDGDKLEVTEEESGEISEDTPDKHESEVATDSSGADVSAKKLTNQFNYCERAAQTYNNPQMERQVQTEPPPRATYCDNVNQWVIHDAYQADFAKQQQEKEKLSMKTRRDDETTKRNMTFSDMPESDDLNKIKRHAKIIERMVNQNTYDEVAQDFRYWEDPCDEFRENEGTLLPLWRFSFDRAKKLALMVTSLCWNPCYRDLFAVSFGSYDFLKQQIGMVCIFTLKNPSYPECIYTTSSSVVCLDIHPTYSHMLVVGMYNGDVAVYNMKNGTDAPQFISDALNGKHTGCVWQVRWTTDNLDGNLNFHSVSSDGRVTNWVMVKTSLWHTDIITLQLDEGPVEGPDGQQIHLSGGGSSFSFHPKQSTLFLVGTEEGYIYKCSTAYSSHYLQTYRAHSMPIHSVEWSPFHASVFISCGTDWKVKVWDQNSSKPLFVFDLNASVNDVAWSPFSSTVFAAVTVDGKVHVYDLSMNKYHPVCVQSVVPKKKTRLTHIRFNPTYPIIIIGDDRGYITSLKLSPNLRKLPKDVKIKTATPEKLFELEVEKMTRLLELVREPDD